ncbi:MAG TPA: hypothetical protein ENH18_02005 [Nitrospirae bacterium]|nr:bacterial regulatory protein, Fis family [bacterium BMS3Bbin09]HDH34002.1 hypothetical protein [Nitrospirota bacterium]HDN94949.1 hypothetical protein [Nitrospirota bacterium]HDO66949.1 hypothetical protein [Nitrospirota bacterium]HEW81123.1 hypothetical protein [Nitrospirota bacterium]
MNSLKTQIELIEKKAIMTALRDCSCVQARAAMRLGITERMIGYKIKIEKGTHLKNEY